MQEAGHLQQTRPMCVLDFYVHETSQREGLGKLLFEAMLQHQGTQAVALAYDRPSGKLLAFLRKHYGLATPQRQANSFVVFPDFLALSAIFGQ